jgi:Tol biopolymer transport system component
VAPEGIVFPSPGFMSCNGALATWSPDGRSLAASALDPAYQPSIALVDASTGEGRLLDVGMPICGMVWSPIEPLLALTAGPTGAEAVYVSDPDGAGLRRLSPEGRQASVLSFAPDGQGVLADLDGEGAVMFGLEGGQRAVTSDPGVSLSPDGRWASFIRGGVAGTWEPHELYVAPLDGTSEPRRLSEEVCCPGTWSPDGTLMASMTSSWSESLIFDSFGDAPVVRVPSQGNIGIISWQALR